MDKVVPRIEDRASRTLRDRLIDLIAIETRIVDSFEHWADAVRDQPWAAEVIERMQATSISHRDALQSWRDTTPGGGGPTASDSLMILVPPQSASKALEQAAEAALEAAFACEAAYQTARLSGDADACDMLEAQISDHGASVADAQRALPRTVARELRRVGVTCTCPCPACSIGACGCVRATMAAVESALTGAQLARTTGLILHSPPRPGSQLADAGLEEDDRVLAVDGAEVGRNTELQAALRRHEVGEEARLEVERRGGERSQVIVRRVG